jgi:hypothetical protein
LDCLTRLGTLFIAAVVIGLLPQIRLCPEDLLWRSENRDSIVTVWRLQRRTAN